jgi:hypothetical protein
MSSSRSPSPDSNNEDLLAPPDPLRLAGSDRTQVRRGGPFSADRWGKRHLTLSNWPVLFLLPALIAITQAAAITPLTHLIFGESFGLTSGHEAPWPGGLALVGLAGFYSTFMLARMISKVLIAQILSFVAWLGVTLIWLGTVPDYDVKGLIGDPWSLVSEHGYMVGPLFLAMGCFWQGIRYASEPMLMAADDIRGMIQRSWAILLGGIVFAAVLNNPSADTAISASRIAVPIAAITSMALIAAAETESTRQVARSRGAKGPQWSRWFKLVASLSAVSLVLALIVVVLLGPEALAAGIHAIYVVGRLVLIGAGYVLYAIFFLVYQVIRAVYYLLNMIFGDMNMKPPEQPEMFGGQQGPPPEIQQGETEPWAQAELIRWIALAIALLIVAFILFRFARRRPALTGEGVTDEERDSVFSTGLLKDQLKGLFRRKPRGEQIQVLDLTTTPATIRESFMYLHVLANRQDAGRREAETPDDFARRLRGVWPGTAESLRDLVRGYQRVRYGDAEDTETNPDLPPTRRAWHNIWERRKDWEPPEEEDGET